MEVKVDALNGKTLFNDDDVDRIYIKDGFVNIRWDSAISYERKTTLIRLDLVKKITIVGGELGA